MTDKELKDNWSAVIAKIDKYFNTPIVKHDDGDGWEIREIVVGTKRAWVFDILRNLVGNAKDGSWTSEYSTNFAPSRTAKVEVRTSDYQEFKCSARKFLNGNTQIKIEIIKY